MYNYFKKTQRHYINKEAKSFADLAQQYRSRRKFEFGKLIHIVITVVFLMVAFRFGTLFTILLYTTLGPNGQPHAGLQVKLPKARSSDKLIYSQYYQNSTYKSKVYIWVNTRADIVMNDFRVKDIWEMRKFIREEQKKKPIKIIILKIDQEAKMGMFADVMYMIKPFIKTEKNPKGIPLFLATR